MMLIKFKREADYIYINPKFIVSITPDCEHGYTHIDLRNATWTIVKGTVEEVLAKLRVHGIKIID